MCGGVGSVRRAQRANGCNNLNKIILSKFNVTITNNNEKYIYAIFNTIDLSIKCFATCYTSENFTNDFT